MLKHLAKNGTKYKKKQRTSKFDKLLKVNTSQYTVQELQSMTGEDPNQLRKYLAKHKLSYKKVKLEPKPKTNKQAITITIRRYYGKTHTTKH